MVADAFSLGFALALVLVVVMVAGVFRMMI